jgi:hypothetical protein
MFAIVSIIYTGRGESKVSTSYYEVIRERSILFVERFVRTAIDGIDLT